MRRGEGVRGGGGRGGGGGGGEGDKGGERKEEGRGKGIRGERKGGGVKSASRLAFVVLGARNICARVINFAKKISESYAFGTLFADM